MTRREGFTLVEVLVATAVMLIVILILLEVVTRMTGLWQNSSGSISSFESARPAFTTINRILARATLKSYVDYVDGNNPPFGNFRTTANASTFTPANFARASELHFICGPSAQLTTQTSCATGATASANPGDAVFFQAPLGVVHLASDKYLRQSLNSLGFYVQYGDIDTSTLPTFLQSVLGGASHRYGFRLIEYVQPTENLSIYDYTSGSSYSLAWLPATVPNLNNSATSLGNSVLAENVLLLIFRPRLEPQDEATAASELSSLGTSGITYDPTKPSTTGSIISPNYNYDSRTWMPGYTFGANSVKDKNYGLLMRNQLPPVVDVAMVCADPASLVHLQLSSKATAPAALLPIGLFTKSDDADFNADLATYGAQLSGQHIRYKIFRSSVEIQGASWTNQ